MYVNPPVSVIMPQYNGMAHFFVIRSNPPSCQMMRNTSSHVLHASGRDMHRVVSMSGARWWSIITFFAGDAVMASAMLSVRCTVLKSRQNSRSAPASISSANALCLSYLTMRSVPGSHCRKSG